MSRDERRIHPRYAPDEPVPVLFGHPNQETPSAGHIVDVSHGGVRIVAPPTAQPHLHWSDRFWLQISWSEDARATGAEGTLLRARVVRLNSDAGAYVLQAEFDRSGSDGDWDALARWTVALSSLPKR
jgi:hypothetical protein